MALALRDAGNKLFAEERYAEARDEYTASLAAGPTAAAYTNRAACHLRLDDAQAALDDARRALDLDRLWVRAYQRRAQAERELGDVAAAEASCRAGLALEEGSLPLRRALQELRDAGHETHDLGDRGLRDPAAAAAHRSRAKALLKAGKFPDAAERFTDALAMDPADAAAFAGRALARCEGGSAKPAGFARALADADRALALRPAFADGLGARSEALFGLGRYKEACQVAREGLSVAPEDGDLRMLYSRAAAEANEAPEVQETMAKLREDQRVQREQAKFAAQLQAAGAALPGELGDLLPAANASVDLDDSDLRSIAREIVGKKDKATEPEMEPIPEGMTRVPEPLPRSMFERQRKEATAADLDALFRDADQYIKEKMGP